MSVMFDPRRNLPVPAETNAVERRRKQFYREKIKRLLKALQCRQRWRTTPIRKFNS